MVSRNDVTEWPMVRESSKISWSLPPWVERGGVRQGTEHTSLALNTPTT